MRLCHAAWVKSPHISLCEHVDSDFPLRNVSVTPLNVNTIR